MYYSYHKTIQKKIKNHELINYEFVPVYNKIPNALVLYFEDGKVYPIREHRFIEYATLINKYFDNKNGSN